MRNKTFSKEYSEFLPDVLEITESSVSPMGRIVIWILFVVIVAMILWSYFGQLDMVATCRGTIIPDGNVKVVQSYESGIITNIFVDDGQYVKEGELLIEIDPEIKKSDVITYERLLSDELIKQKTIKNILDGVTDRRTLLETLDIDASLPAKELIVDSFLSSINENKSEIEILKSKRAQAASQYGLEISAMNKIESNIEICKREINNLTKELYNKSVEDEKLELLNSQEKSIFEMVQKSKTLYDQGIIAESEYISYQNSLIEAEHQREIQQKNIELHNKEKEDALRNINDALNALQHDLLLQQDQISVVKKEIDIYDKNISYLSVAEVQTFSDMLMVIEEKIINYQNLIDKGVKSISFNKLYAPVSGKVHGLAINTIGAVTKPGESIMTIVPEGTKLVAEAVLLNKDIGFVEAGQKTTIKVETYPFQKFGSISGTVESISPMSYFDQNLGFIYKIKVSLDSDYVMSEEKKYEIFSGMQVSVEIKTGKRRILDFFLEPITKYIEESFKLR